MTYTVALSRVGRDQRADVTLDVTADGPLAARIEAVKEWRAQGNTGHVYTVDVRPKVR